MKTYHCSKSNFVEQLEVLERRLESNDIRSNEISMALRQELAGIKGQNALRFPLEVAPFHKSVIAINNPRIQDKHGYFEIDTLILAPNYILLLEVKNWYGTLYIDEDRQFIRKGDDGLAEGMPNPISQVWLQRHRLENWLKARGILQEMPIMYFVVIGFSSTIIKPFQTHQPIPPEVIHSNRLPHEVSQLEEKYPKSLTSKRDLVMAARAILRSHIVKEINVLEHFHVEPHEIRNGVFCLACNTLGMRYHYGKWHCVACKYAAADAHLHSLRDYQLLFGPSVKNAEARAFLNLNSPDVIRRLLTEASLEAAGAKKQRTYLLKPPAELVPERQMRIK